VTGPGALSLRHPSHVGVATRDLEEARRVLGPVLGLRWGDVATDVEPGLGGPDGSLAWRCHRCRSLDDFPLELLEGDETSTWATDELATLHHIGYWSDDHAGEVVALEADGWALEATLRGPAGEVTAFAYLRRPGSVRIELVDVARRPAPAVASGR
jgi:catechol 2,3-dioxygenase-like lactoylglutathione lyase family enzyme